MSHGFYPDPDDPRYQPEDVSHNPSSATPEKKRKKRKLPKIISKAEAQALLDAADNGTPRGKRDRVMLELMYRAGLRVSEVVKLDFRDVERDGVIKIYDGKGGDGTAYFTPELVLPHLDAWLLTRQIWAPNRYLREHAQARLFCNEDGSVVTVRYIQRLVAKLKEKVGIRGIVTPHVFRHTFATELLEEGWTISQVQSALRHRNLATTAVYLHVRDETLRRKMSRRGSPANFDD